MKRLLKNELIKMFSNIQIYLTIGIGTCLTIILTCMQVHIRAVNEKLFMEYGMKGDLYYPSTVYNSFIGLDYLNLPALIFYTILPIMATLPFAASYYKEKKSGYLKNVLVKTDKNKYYISKYLMVFFSGFITILVTSLISLIITMMFFPALKPELVTQTYTISTLESMWFDLFATHPMMYVLAYILLDSVFCGALALITLVISMFVNNLFIVYTGTMIICIIWDYVAKILNKVTLSPQIFLRPAQYINGIKFSNIMILFIIIIFTSGILFLGVEKRKDVM